jgi:hypothetical protein
MQVSCQFQAACSRAAKMRRFDAIRLSFLRQTDGTYGSRAVFLLKFWRKKKSRPEKRRSQPRNQSGSDNFLGVLLFLCANM